MNGNFSQNKKKYLKKLIYFTVSIVLILWCVGLLNFTCPIYSLTSIYCPMCKSTRAIQLLIEQKLVDSFKMNPLALFWMYFLGLSYLNFSLETFNIKNKKKFLSIEYIFSHKYLSYIIYIIVFLNVLFLNLN